jgi:hypothetical protein
VPGQKPFAGYPSQAPRPGAAGSRYRISVMGPGVTPVLMWEASGLPNFNGGDPSHHRIESIANVEFDRVMAGDRICRHER